jgi:hypothetical protein
LSRMKLVTSMLFWGALMLNTPFLAERSTGTVMFLQVMAEAAPMKAAAAATVEDRVMMELAMDLYANGDFD